VCPTVGCVDKKTDPANCGACGTVCAPTSTCNGGMCGPAPMMLAGAISGCNGLTMVATDAVYFADAANGTINKLGAPTPLATDQMGATMLQANGTDLYWYAKGSKTIRSVATSGGAVTDVYTVSLPDSGAPPDVAGFLVSPDGVNIYVSLGSQVLEAPVAGGATSVVANVVHGGLPAALALDGTTSIVFPATFNGEIDVALLSAMPATCDLADASGNDIMTTCARLARAHGDLLPSFIAVLGGHAYWINGLNIYGELIDGPMGTYFESIASAQTTKITAAAATADTIYFADADPQDPAGSTPPGGFIEKTALAPSSTAILLARGQTLPLAIAVDATKVYWATSDCAIMSVSR
jgi:hypothetical protein